MKTWQMLKTHPELWERYFIREKVLTAIRRFFLDRKFHEVETPYLTGSLPPESYLDIFETTLLDRNRKSMRAYLPTSPEPFIKKLLVAGIGNCFAIPKSFRNTEDKSCTHNPEFTILEWYRVNADYSDIMADCEELVLFINAYLQRSQKPPSAVSLKPTELTYQGKRVDISTPWERLTVSEACMKYAKIDLGATLTRSSIAEIAKKKGYQVDENDSWEELFHLIFLNEVEPNLGRGKPTIIYDYPVQLAALARTKSGDPRFAERFEFYIEGLELGDAYSELTDAQEQLQRFREEEAERKRLGKTEHPVDMDFIDALKVGMPPAGGIAVGVDRLIMLFADTTDIADTLFFPMRDLFDA
ncbi:EF-P lysine aminoacylase GenX [Candidatus Gottesmanbacteria bacterium]|nr:EF-P lysine aminoacylase GenX [Candidatus Gottesmanbacteria bacterium]